MLELYTWARGWPGPHGARILELGVCRGNSTSAFLAALEVDRKGCLWSVDFGPRHPDIPDAWLDRPDWNVLWENSMSDAAREWAPKELDVLFIDSDHSYEITLGELMMYAPRVRPGGVVLCHDTEDYKAVPASFACDPHESGPGRALDTYCAMKQLSWDNRAGNHGLGVMRIR
jgi:predicted O-methyltransferase YrrM